MLRTIKFNNQLRFTTSKVGEITVDWKLPHKFESIETSATQLLPERIFGVIPSLP